MANSSALNTFCILIRLSLLTKIVKTLHWIISYQLIITQLKIYYMYVTTRMLQCMAAEGVLGTKYLSFVIFKH